MKYIKLFEEFIKSLNEFAPQQSHGDGGFPPIDGDDGGNDDDDDDANDPESQFDPHPATITMIRALNWYIGDEDDMSDMSSQLQSKNSKGFVLVSDPMKHTIEPIDDYYEDEGEDVDYDGDGNGENDGMGRASSGDFEDIWKIHCFDHNGGWVVELIFPVDPYVFGRKIASSPESIIKIAEKWSGVHEIKIINLGKNTPRTPWATATSKEELAKIAQKAKSGGARGMSQDAQDIANASYHLGRRKTNDN